MEGKKISFGFMKTKKAEKTPVEETKDYIECVEEKSIKVIGGVAEEETKPLVIPMKPNTLITTERLKQIAEKVESALEEPETNAKPSNIEDKAPESETLDQMVVRKLMQDAKKETKVDIPALMVPIPSKPFMDGQKESTLGDYAAVPIEEFGLAMLRGMGWTPSKEQSKYKQPQLRPKGLGLGADKVVKKNQKNKSTKDGKDEDLAIVKNSFVKITTGKYSGYYGKVVSLDEDNGRVMVDINVKKETVSLSEFMMHPVTKAEFDKESKVINADTFEEYKKSEKVSQKSKYDERAASSSRTHDFSNEKRERSRSQRDIENSNGKEKSRDSSSSEERSSGRRMKEKKRYSSCESLSSLSDSDRRRHKKKERRRHSSDSETSDSKRKSKKKNGSPVGKRDIDKKRKGKKKKRDRDRSPNYRKHRK